MSSLTNVLPPVITQQPQLKLHMRVTLQTFIGWFSNNCNAIQRTMLLQVCNMDHDRDRSRTFRLLGTALQPQTFSFSFIMYSIKCRLRKQFFKSWSGSLTLEISIIYLRSQSICVHWKHCNFENALLYFSHAQHHPVRYCKHTEKLLMQHVFGILSNILMFMSKFRPVL